MAEITSLALVALTTRILDTGSYNVTNKMAFTNGVANNADAVDVFTVARNGRISGADLNAKATLGAGCTLQLRRFRPGDSSTSVITPATTAGGASMVNSGTIGPQDVLAGDIIQALVGGANVTAAASVEVDVRLQH